MYTVVHMQEHEKSWQPLTVEEVTYLFVEASFPVWIAGGIGLELALGQTIREYHSDIDVFLLRRDHLEARQLLADWDCWAADPPGSLRPWPVGQVLSTTVHDIWCRRSPDGAWQLQLMIDEVDACGNWVSRRDCDICAPIDEITGTTGSGIDYLAPHIQLYYKAKNPREKDQIDFEAIIDSGISVNTNWLRRAISHSYGAMHPWLKRLPE